MNEMPDNNSFRRICSGGFIMKQRSKRKFPIATIFVNSTCSTSQFSHHQLVFSNKKRLSGFFRQNLRIVAL